jgi:hypothetical protein
MSVSDALDRFSAFIDGLTLEPQQGQIAGSEDDAHSSIARPPGAATSGAATIGCSSEGMMDGYHARADLPSGRKPDKAAWTLNRQEVAQRLSQQLDAENAASAARAPKAVDGQSRPDTKEAELLDAIRDAWPNAIVLPAEPKPPPPPPEHLVQRLAAALATPRPWMHVADPERAASYFRARALHMLAAVRDPVAVAEREEREAARWAASTTGTTNPKGSAR